MSAITGHSLKGVEEIFGIKRIRSIDVRIACDEIVTAKVEFLMDEIQVNAFLELCRDGKWRSPPAVSRCHGYQSTVMDDRYEKTT